MLHRLRERLRSAGRDRGSYTTELIMGIAVAVGIATAVGAILTGHFTGAAESLDLGIDP
jgi:hypothetical protein